MIDGHSTAVINMISALPAELLRSIVRFATEAPSIFDTSYKAVLEENRSSTFRSMRRSLADKHSLSLVSRRFQSITEEFLYEFIILQSCGIEVVRFLAERLATRPSQVNGLLPIGHRVRRIDIDIELSDGEAYDWFFGLSNLWGLIPSCPKLTILVSSVVLWQPLTLKSEVDNFLSMKVFEIPIELLMTIAGTCAQTLRRIDIMGQLTVSIDHLTQFCSSTRSTLEVCRFARVHKGVHLAQPTIPLFNHQSISETDSPDDSGESDSPVGCDGSSHDDVVLPTVEFVATKWPHDRPDPMGLGPLHTLDLGGFHPLLWDWEIPKIRHVGVNVPRHLPSLESHFITFKQGIEKKIPPLRSFAFSGRVYRVWDFVDLMPFLERLMLRDIYQHSTDHIGLSRPHPHLSMITVDRYLGRASPDWILSMILEICLRQLLPALRLVRLVGPASQTPLRIEMIRVDFARLDVRIELDDCTAIYRPDKLLYEKRTKRRCK